jgi:autoinducer 2-binding protein LuxP
MLFRVSCWIVYPITIVFLLFTTSYSSKLRAAQEYITIDRYLSQHPAQRDVMAEFSEIVRAPAEPVMTHLKRSVRIAVIYPGLQTSDYWRRSLVSFERRLQNIQLRYELKSFFSLPSVDAGLQSRQLSEALQWQPDYLVFTLDISLHSRMIERILSRGKPKLILQNITTPLLRWQMTPPFMYIGFDHAQGTQLLAREMLEQINHQGKYLMLYFSPGYVSQMRGGTFAAEAAKYPNVTQVKAYYTDGNQDKAYQATLATLQQHPDLKMIFACSTDIALGALQALRESNRLDILVNGWGGGDAELQALQHQELDLTVMRINDDNGIAMAEAIKLDLLNQQELIPHIYSGDIELLTKEQPASKIIRLKQRSFRLSGLPQEID